jgi:hypothetical protein
MPPVQAADEDFFGEFSTKSGASIVSQPRETSRPYDSINVGPRSVASSLGNQSARSTASILDDKTFAPPPKYPKSLQLVKSDPIFAVASSKLPEFDMIKHSGDCLARFSLKSMVIKKWRPTFWISYGPHQLLFFRSKSDFEEWVSNPILKKEERDKLVKLNVDFVNDLYVPHVIGYKATALRMKGYS